MFTVWRDGIRRVWEAPAILLGAWAITLLLLGALIALLENETVTQPLRLWYHVAFGSVVVWFILGPLWSLLFLSWKRSDP